MQSILGSGDIRVKYPSGNVWTINPDTVVKVRDRRLLTWHFATLRDDFYIDLGGTVQGWRCSPNS